MSKMRISLYDFYLKFKKSFNDLKFSKNTLLNLNLNTLQNRYLVLRSA